MIEGIWVKSMKSIFCSCTILHFRLFFPSFTICCFSLYFTSCTFPSATGWPVAEGKVHDVNACKIKQNWWHQPHATLIKTKKSINHKPNIKIKFRSHHWISDNKNFETRSYLTIFWQTFLFIFLITVVYSVIARTKRMKCQNKREQLSEQFICHPEQ
jgi:hypothetical protein